MKISRKQWERIWIVASKRGIDPDQLKYIGMVRFHKSARKEHEQAKFDKCFELYHAGVPFICETQTWDRKRKIDVLDLIDNIAYEFETDHKVKKDNSRVVKI